MKLNIRQLQYILLFIVVGYFVFAGFVSAEEENNNFDILLALTQQDPKLDWWWFSFHSQFGQNVSPIDEVTKNEYFKILPIFNYYGTTNVVLKNGIFHTRVVRNLL